MFTSISEFVKARTAGQTTPTKVTQTNESSVNVTNTKIAKDKGILKLESVIRNLSVCHFIMNKGLISESSSLTAINEALEGEFGETEFFKNEEEFNAFYSQSMEETKAFLMDEGFLDKLAGLANKTTNKSYVLDNIIPSEKATAFLNDPKYKKTVELAKQALISKSKVPQDKAETALTAMLNWTNGETPNFVNTSVTYDAAKNEITFGANSKGTGAKVF